MSDIEIEVFIHRSNKTRIETMEKNRDNPNFKLFLYIDPLKQGLKLKIRTRVSHSTSVFIHRSIKTRIETT